MSRKRVFLLIRGLVRGKGHWADFPEYLQAIMKPEDKIIFVDLPGNGEFQSARSPWSMARTAQMVRENFRAQAKGEGDELIAVAISMGAMVVVSWMQQFPGEITQGFLINTSSARHSFILHRFDVTATLLNPGYWFAADQEMKSLEITCNNPQRIKLCYPHIRQYTDEHPVRLMDGGRQLWAAATYPFPRKAPGPVVLLCADGDRLVNPDCSRAIAKAWNVPLEVNPSAGHDLTLDDPQWTVESIGKYL